MPCLVTAANSQNRILTAQNKIDPKRKNEIFSQIDFSLAALYWIVFICVHLTDCRLQYNGTMRLAMLGRAPSVIIGNLWLV